MFIIWRGWGWLILPFLLAVWGLADGPVAAVYRSVSGDDALFNPEKGVCWAIALVLVSVPLAALGLWRKHAERTRTPEETAAENAHRLAAIAEWERMRIAEGQDPDPQTQTILAGISALPPLIRPKSSFFFVPFWLFGFVFAALGVLVLVLNLPEALSLL